MFRGANWSMPESQSVSPWRPDHRQWQMSLCSSHPTCASQVCHRHWAQDVWPNLAQCAQQTPGRWAGADPGTKSIGHSTPWVTTSPDYPGPRGFPELGQFWANWEEQLTLVQPLLAADSVTTSHWWHISSFSLSPPLPPPSPFLSLPSSFSPWGNWISWHDTWFIFGSDYLFKLFFIYTIHF